MTRCLRPAGRDDYPLFARLFPTLGSGDAVPSRSTWTEVICPETVVALQAGEPVGYCYAQTLATEGYVRHLAVDADVQGAGVGRALIEHAATGMRARGCRRWRLNVRPDNVPAVGLYSSLGMRTQHESVSLRFTWSILDRLASPPAARIVCAPDPAQMQDAEQRFDLPAGQLAAAAAREDVAVRVLRASEATLGVAAFDVGFPGCFPFRARGVPDAISLLHGLRPVATQDAMGLVAEAHPELEAVLLAAGARAAFRFVHMSGLL